MKHYSAYQIGVIRDYSANSDDVSDIYSLCLDVVQAAKRIKESYNAPASAGGKFDDLSVSSAASLSYAVWHYYSQIVQG